MEINRNAPQGRGRAAGRDGVSRLPGATVTVRFLCELAMLAALAYWGFTVGDGACAWVLGIGAPLLAAIVWGAWVARRPAGRCRSRPGW